ncbi:MAG: hypothetical protein IOD12_00330 [Silvanigrellales bacterium]|jgi:hypothetical protein|nr:hypothetical protein [Silvanigrellales bacterium]
MSEALLPVEAIELLVNKVVAKFSRGDISLDEAAVRLLGTGRFEEKPEAVEFLRNDVCPQIEEQLKVLEDDIARLQAQANLLRNVLGVGAPQASLLASASNWGAFAAAGTGSSQAASAARAKKEKTGSEKKRRGAASESAEESRGENSTESYSELSAEAPAESAEPVDSLESVWATEDAPTQPAVVAHMPQE